MVSIPQIGPYLLESELGRGAMGVVYRAVDPRVGRRVALKLVWAVEGEEAERFAHEAEAAGRLRHKNVVAVHDFARAQGRMYLVSELVEGPSLAQVLEREGPLEPARAADLVARLSAGVEHAHAAGVLHRDIKPANVLLDGDEPRLTDFGVARLGQGVLTQTGQILGTPSFMSPEQAAGNRALVDARTDVYALGATLYALLTGRPPFAEGSLISTLNAVLSSAPQPPSQLAAAVPPALEAIVLRALAKQPAERYSSAAALGSALEEWRAGSASAAGAESPRRTLLAIAGSGLGVVAVVVAVGFALNESSAAPGPTPDLAAASRTPQPKRAPLSREQAERALAVAATRWQGEASLDPPAALEGYLQAARHLPEAWEGIGQILAAGRCEEADLARAQVALAEAAESGDLRALRALAQAEAAGVRGTPPEAERWCLRLAEQDPVGLVWLGERVLRGGDRARAEDLFRRAHARGESAGAVRLGRMLLDERGDRVVEGLDLLQAAAEAGDPAAVYELGEANYNGWGVPVDQNLGLDRIQKAARRDVLSACYRLGLLKGGREGAEEGLRWLRRGAEGGDPLAMVTLARALSLLGGEAAHTEAARWAERADSRGNEFGLIVLAAGEVRGQKGEKNVNRGLDALRTLSARGSRHAALQLGVELEALGRIEEAREAWRPLVAEGLPAAQSALGASLAKGAQSPAEREEGIRLLEAALGKNFGEAALHLGELFEEREPQRALNYFDRASAMRVLGAEAAGARLRARLQAAPAPRDR